VPHDKLSDAVASLPPLVSVIIDTYNYGHFIEEAIDSVLSQEFPVECVEILVVDDGSTDDTAERVKKYGEQVHYFYKPNAGQASAFNFGFQHAKGEIIALLDADDYFLPSKLRRVTDEFKKHKDVGMIYHELLEIDQKSNKINRSKIVPISGFLPDDKSRLFAFRTYPTSSMIFARQALALILPMPETITLQADGYIAVLVPLIAPVLALQEPLSVYRIHGDNLFYSQSNNPSVERRKRRAQMFAIIANELKTWGISHKEHLRRMESQLFLDQWTLWIQEDGFQLASPGRITYFWFLVNQNRAFASQQNWKFTVFNYVSAVFALIFGYERSKNMYKWRMRWVAAFQSMSRWFLGRRQ